MKAVDILYLSLGMMLYPLFACGSNATDNKKDIATYFANSLKVRPGFHLPKYWVLLRGSHLCFLCTLGLHAVRQVL